MAKPGTTVEHPTPDERAARGRAVRAEVPRSAHAEWDPPPGRTDPIAILEAQSATRLPDLVPIRYGRMLVSPFAFFRGAAAVMAADLADGVRTGLLTQLCGDAHLSNFGVFAAPDRRLTFDVNDFDETLPGPFEWDLKRLAASFAVLGRERGFSTKERANVTRRAVASYREAMAQFAAMRTLDLWYARVEVDELVQAYGDQATPRQSKRIQQALGKARTRDSLRAFEKLTEVVDGEPRILSDPPLLVRLDELTGPEEAEAAHTALHALVRNYRRTLAGDRRRPLEPYLGRSVFANNGQRVVEGQRLMQASSDIFLGWLRATSGDETRDFYVRQLWDQKGTATVDSMRPDELANYGRLCGWTLAKAHARAGDAIAIASYLGTGDVFDAALAAFAERYADQNERDFALLEDAAASGRIDAERGL